MGNMGTSELLKHIYDINLSYLLLAQRLINDEKRPRCSVLVLMKPWPMRWRS